MSKTTRVQPHDGCYDDGEEDEVLGKCSSSGDYAESMPAVGKFVKLATDPSRGFCYVVGAQLSTKILELGDIDEQSNTFQVALEVTLTWDRDDSNREFWKEFCPLVYFENAVDDRSPIFCREDVREFQCKKRTQRNFRKTMELVDFPFDSQTLPIEFYTEAQEIFGRLVRVYVNHPSVDGHLYRDNADCVDDMRTFAIFGLAGDELAPEFDESSLRSYPKAKESFQNKYVVLLFVSRRAESTVYNVYLPLFLMYVLSFLAFLVPPCAVHDRASVTLTLFLSVIALKSYMTDRLPKVPYSTAVEYFLILISFILVIQSCAMMAAASYCVRYGSSGQFGLDPDAFDRYDPLDQDENGDDWDCKTGYSDEGKLDYWCQNRRVRKQVMIDTAAVGASVLCGLLGACLVIVKYCKLWKRKYHIKRLVQNYHRNSANAPSRNLRRVDHDLIERRRHILNEANVKEESRVYSSWVYAFAKDHGLDFLLPWKFSSPVEDEGSKQDAVRFFAQKYRAQSYTYGNSELKHLFCDDKVEAEKSTRDIAAGIDTQTASLTTICFDLGTGETKAIVASIEPEDRNVIIEAKGDGKPFMLNTKKVAIADLCSKGKTNLFIEWVSKQVYPTHEATVPVDSSDDIGEVFKPLKVVERNNNLYEIENEATAILKINGVKYDDKIAKECLERGRQIAKAHFRNPIERDRVVSLVPQSFQRSDETQFWIRQGDKGTVVAADHHANKLAPDNEIVYMLSVVWDVEPSTECTVIQRRYQATKEKVTRDLKIMPINEVRLECVCNAEVAPGGATWVPPAVVVGTGAWFRNSQGPTRDNAQRMFEELKRRYPDWHIERNTDLDECWYELLAVSYAFKKCALETPHAVLAVGRGSTQYSCIAPPEPRDKVTWATPGEKESHQGIVKSREWISSTNEGHHSFKYGVLEFLKDRRGDVRIKDAEIWAHDVKPTTKYPKLIPCMLQVGNKQGISFFEAHQYSCKDLECSLTEVIKAWFNECRELLIKMVKENQICRGLPKTVACISACWYAASHSQLAKKFRRGYEKDGSMVVTAAEARKGYQEALDDITKLLRYSDYDGKDKVINLSEVLKEINGKHPKATVNAELLSNLTYQQALCEVLFDDDTSLRFCREWNIQKRKFRTTWSAGFYLNRHNSAIEERKP